MKSAPSIYTGSVMNVANLPTAHANIKGYAVTDPRDEFPHNRISQEVLTVQITELRLGIDLTPTIWRRCRLLCLTDVAQAYT